MPCIAAPHIGLPDIGLTMPSIAIPEPSIGIELCCKFQTPPIDMATINAIIAAAIALIPGLGKVLGPVLSVLMKFIAVVNKILDKIQFSCPLN